MLSFFVLSITWMVKSHYLKAAIAFSISLLFKQMSLYFALPIFTYLVSQCLHRKRKGIFLFFQLAITVLSTFSLFLFPFRSSLDQLFYRIFPIQRGVFEDKVASFWCTFNPLFKFRTRFSSSILLIS
ncbi:Glucosyltransferase-like protein, partial [Coelomomyces lativittatus]